MFYDAEKFEFIRLFQDQWSAIHQEYKNLKAEIKEEHRNSSHEEYFAKALQETENGWVPSWQLGSPEKNYSWLTYWLSYERNFSAQTKEKLPALAAILEKTPSVRLCAFSKMMPLSVIGMHSHPELGGNILTFHLGVELVDGTCYLNVGNQFQAEGNNKAIVFDGSKPHFAVNAGLQPRTILYMEFDQSK